MLRRGIVMNKLADLPLEGAASIKAIKTSFKIHYYLIILFFVVSCNSFEVVQ